MFFHALLIGVGRRRCGVFLQLPCEVLVSLWGGCICTCEDGKRKGLWVEKNNGERYAETFLFPSLLVIYLFPSECLLDLTSVMQEVTQSSEQCQVMYCICLSHHSLPPLTLHVCWHLKLQLRF